jgi:hypothetical protein
MPHTNRDYFSTMRRVHRQSQVETFMANLLGMRR